MALTILPWGCFSHSWHVLSAWAWWHRGWRGFWERSTRGWHGRDTGTHGRRCLRRSFQQWDKVSGSESLSINIEAISLEPLVEGLLGTWAVVKIHATESNIPYAGVECIDVLFFIILLWLFASLFGCTLQAPPPPWYSLHGASLKLESSGFAHLAFAKRHIRMHKRHKRHIRMHRMHKAQVLG